MPDNTINTLQSTANDYSPSTRFVRTQGAANAQGFAQIMQAFESPAESPAESIVEDISESQQESIADSQDDSDESTVQEDDSNPTASQSDDSSQGSQTNTESASAADAQPVDPKSDQPQQDEHAGNSDPAGSTNHLNTQSAQQQEVVDPALETTQEQATQANDAAFRLLENQSDQAKLTIKSVSRSLTHAAQANLASLAVETRLGQNQLSNIPVSQEQAQAGQQAQDLPKQETSGPALTAADDSEPNEFSGRNPGSNRDVNVTRPQLQVQHRATHNAGSQQPQVEQQSQTYPAQANTTQSSAQQTDAAGVVSQAAPNLHINADQQRTTRNASQVASVQRAQSNQAVRAITSIDSGNISQQQRDTTQGSLVENMNKTELPSETKRASVLAQVQRGLASLMRSGDSEMTLKLTPGHLGEIRIQIKTNGDRLGIRFETSTQEASEFLKNSVNELSSALRSKGISLEQIQIDRAPTSDEPNARPQDGVGHAPDHQQGGQDAQRHPNDGHPDQSPNDPFAGFESDQNNESQAGQPESIWSQIGLDAIA